MGSADKSDFLDRLVALPRSAKGLILVACDAAILALSLAAALSFRTDGIDYLSRGSVWAVFLPVLALTLILLERLGTYRTVLRHLAREGVTGLVLAVTMSGLMLFGASEIGGRALPRSVPVIYLMVAFLGLAGLRLVYSDLQARRRRRSKTPAIIYGAGEAGRQLLGTLRNGDQYEPVALVDDDPALHGLRIAGVRVHAPRMLDDLCRRCGAGAVFLAIPSLSRPRRREILRRLESLGVMVRAVPGILDIVAGRARIDEVREVGIEELLGREPIPPRVELIGRGITGRVVMVTGAGGSIGAELARRILVERPCALILCDHAESALYAIDMALREECETTERPGPQIVPVLGSVLDRALIRRTITAFHVETILHAAAYKHVPLGEANPAGTAMVNVFGTKVVLEEALRAGARSFTLISTDKAVRPTNVMGASKRMAEFICHAHAAKGPPTRIAVVRFGNVLGSSGSVIPRFRAQIAAGGPITVTHPEITRYFMAIPEAAELVLQAAGMAEGGEVFLLDMGKPIRILDLALQMARLSGLQPHVEGEPGTGDIEIRFTGLRPGEKLYEELLIDDDAEPSEHPRIMCARERFLLPAELDDHLARLETACAAGDGVAVRAVLSEAPLGYRTKFPADALVVSAW